MVSIDNIKIGLQSIKHYLTIIFKASVLMWECIFIAIQYYFFKYYYCVFTPKNVEYLDDIPQMQKLNSKILSKTFEVMKFKMDNKNIWGLSR